MKTIKFLVFIPVCLIALGLINYGFIFLLNWTIDKSTNWYHDLDFIYFILLMPFFWGTIWGVFKLAAMGIAVLLLPLSPGRIFSLYSLGVLSLINCLVLIIHFWTREVSYSWRVVVMSMIITIFIIDFSASIVLVFSKRVAQGLED